MKTLSPNIHIAIQVALLALQFLAPAFLIMTPVQQTAVAAFVSALQGFMGWTALNTPPPNAPKQPTAIDEHN